MGKIFWFDTETTGLNPQRNCLVQLAYLIEIDGEIKDEGNLLSSPFPTSVIDKKALDIHGRTEEEIKAYPSPLNIHKDLCDTLSTYINKYDKTDKFIPAGYFTHFDTDMLRSFFKNCGDNYYGSWFASVSLDVSSFVAHEIVKNGLKFENHKLETICRHFKIDLQAHDALSDIKATRELFLKLINGGEV